MIPTSRRAEERDIPFILALYDRPHARGFLRTPTEAFVRAALGDSSREDWIVRIGDECVGFYTLELHESWFVEAALAATVEPRRGVGTFIVDAIVSRAFSELRAHRIYAETTEDNVAMLTLFERRGFVYEGTFRHGTISDDGTYKNLCAYGLLESDVGAIVVGSSDRC